MFADDRTESVRKLPNSKMQIEKERCTLAEGDSNCNLKI